MNTARRRLISVNVSHNHATLSSESIEHVAFDSFSNRSSESASISSHMKPLPQSSGSPAYSTIPLLFAVQAVQEEVTERRHVACIRLLTQPENLPKEQFVDAAMSPPEDTKALYQTITENLPTAHELVLCFDADEEFGTLPTTTAIHEPIMMLNLQTKDGEEQRSEVSNPDAIQTAMQLLRWNESAAPMHQLQSKMVLSQISQARLQEWDKRKGLPKSHSITMMRTNRSRRQLCEGRILSKWNGKPLIPTQCKTTFPE